MKRIFYYTIGKESEGLTIKEYLIHKESFSSALIIKLKKAEDGVILNGKPEFVIKKLSEGDNLKITITETESENIVPTKLDFEIIYEDEDICIVNKPPHMPTHPSIGNFTNTLANGLMYHWKDEKCMFHAVNRLDRDTSGIIMLAKNSYAHALLCEEIKNGTLKRTYKAIVCGKVDGNGTISAPIKRENESIITRCVAEDGQEAITHYKVLENYKNHTLLELILDTGRTHQIRVHMSYIGHPLVADRLYGKEDTILDRQALHSASIEFIHPIIKEKMQFSAKLPKDMESFINSIK